MPKDKIQRSAYVWNTVSGMLRAFQSVIFLVVITRVCGLAVAGVFTIAFALANQFLFIGLFGMRAFQATDVPAAGAGPRYGFGDYLLSRALSSLAMMACAAAYVLWSSFALGYAPDKTLAVLLMCVLKALDAVEDVYHGNYQQHGRLDVAGQLLTVRVAGTILLLGACIAATRDLVVSLAVTVVASALLLAGTVAFARKRHGLPANRRTPDWGRTWRLLRDCAPLFLVSFLTFYVGNAPRYAIDAHLGDLAQAVYGFIAMPVFVVSLLAGLIYAPLVAPLSHLWREGKAGAFVRQFRLQALRVALITAGCVLLAWLAGAPVLAWLYDTDISGHLLDLCVLVAGGGFLALATLFSLGVTILRRQGLLVGGCCLVSVAALFYSDYAVQHWGIAGASWAYLVLMAALALSMLATFVFCVRTGAPRTKG
jgi:O-antigen/teichoic acid export membrane protein